jgi:hypothetical protein
MQEEKEEKSSKERVSFKNRTPKIQNPTQTTRERKRARARREKRKELQCAAARVDANELRRWRGSFAL